MSDFYSPHLAHRTPAIKPWFIFGEHRQEDGVKRHDDKVDIADIDGDVITGVSRATANRIITARDAFVDHVEALLTLEDADPNDNGMGCCAGLLGRPDLVEINCGAMGLDAEEIFTHSSFGCVIGVDKPKPSVLS
jgi:hypothetical protein